MATFGATGGGNAASVGAGDIRYVSAALSEAGTVSSITIPNVKYSAGAGNVKAAIYSGAGALLGYTAAGALPADYADVTVDMTTPLALEAATYRLAFWGAVAFVSHWAAGGDTDNQALAYGTWPDPSTQSAYDAITFDIYATYTAGGGDVSVTPEPAILTGTGDQPAPTISGSAVHAPNHIAQFAEIVDPTLATTQNLGVGSYRSTTVTMNW